MEKKELSKEPTPVEEHKQTKKQPSPVLKSIRHLSIVIIIVGILMFLTLTELFNYMAPYVIVFGVGLFIATKIRIIMWGIPFLLIFLLILYFQNPPASYKQKGYDASANADVVIAYRTAMAYFEDYPNSTISLPKLTSYGFVQSSNNVTLTVASGSQSNLKITAFHNEGTKIYTIDSDGKISSQKR